VSRRLCSRGVVIERGKFDIAIILACHRAARLLAEIRPYDAKEVSRGLC
jgi:hypothetical protein